MAIDFDRDSLYAEVSTTPISSLAKKYGLSDVGLRKICVALDIPLPGRGHWAKIAAGKPSPLPLLHATTGRTHYRFFPSEAPSTPPPTSTDWLGARLSFENDPANKITVSETLDAPSELVKRAKKVADKFVADLERSRDELLKPRKPQKVWMPTLSTGPYWTTYVDKGFLELSDYILPMRVSIGCLDRSLRLWDALLKAAQIRGLSQSIEPRRLRLTAHGHFADLRIAERVERVIGSPKGFSDLDVMLKRHIKNVSTGELRIFVGEKKYTDAAGLPLEDQLNSVFVEVFKTLHRAEVQQQKNVIWRKQHDAEKALAASREAEAAEAKKRAAEERDRELGLEAETAAWSRATAIRAYALAVSNAAPVPMPKSIDAWVTWANTVAERIDPLPTRAGLTELENAVPGEQQAPQSRGLVLPG